MRANSKEVIAQKRANYVIGQKIDMIFDDIQLQIAQQLIAAMLYTLEVSEGYGAKRIRRIFNALSSTYDDMRGVGFVSEFDGDDLIERAKERYGIDILGEVTVGKHKAKGGKQ